MNTLAAFFAMTVIAVASRAFPLNNNNIVIGHDWDALRDMVSDNPYFGQNYGYNLQDQYLQVPLFNQGFNMLTNQGFSGANSQAFNFLNNNFNQGSSYLLHDEIEQPEYRFQYY